MEENTQITAHHTAPNSLVPMPSEPGAFLKFITDAANLMMGAQTNRLMPGIQTKHELAMIMGYAATLGLNPLSATQEIHIINGRMAISAEAMRALANRAGVTIEIESEDAEHCAMIFQRNGQTHTETFTVAEAKQAGLIKPGGNWTKWPKQMMRARCTTNGIRFFCPDVLQGVLEISEAEAIDEPPAYQARVVEPATSSKATQEPEDDYIDAEIEPEDEPDPNEIARDKFAGALKKAELAEATWPQWIEGALEEAVPFDSLTAEQAVTVWEFIKSERTKRETEAIAPPPQCDDYGPDSPLLNAKPVRALWKYAGLTLDQTQAILADWGGELDAKDITSAELLGAWHATWARLAYDDGKLTYQEADENA